jgi:hypothetical protein
VTPASAFAGEAMRSILIFAGAYILSLVVAYAVGLQVAEYFLLGEEPIAGDYGTRRPGCSR